MGEFITGEAACERLRELADQVDTAYAEMRELSSDEVGNAFRTELAERLETQERTNRGLSYRMFGQIADPPDETAMAPALVNSLAARLRIPPREVKRRMKTAGRMRPRRQLTGPPLSPELPHVADAVSAGAIGEDHLRVIGRAIDVLPSCVSATDRDDVERSLVREATKNDAEIVKAVARRIDEIFNPDGDFDEADRARRRGLTLGQQGQDGMSRLSGYIDPETRAYLEAVTAAVRPGRHLPDGTLTELADERSGAQRPPQAGGAPSPRRQTGPQGRHRLRRAGDPSGACGHRHRAHHAGRTESGRPCGDQPRHPDAPAGAHRRRHRPADARRDPHGRRRHPLPGGVRRPHRTPLYLGRQTRIATADQRIICYARDGGCTRPGCLAPGYHSEVHHSPDWSPDGKTDADSLFFACAPDHKLITDGHYRTTATDTGRLTWTDGTTPPEVNHAHHPEELLRGDTDPPENCED